MEIKLRRHEERTYWKKFLC